jgi:hypothetical protein
MRRLWMIALTAAFVGSGSFASSLFAEGGDARNCATKLATFVEDLDSLLARNPRDLNVIYELLLHHFPVHGCTANVASQASKTSAYFKGEERVSGGRSTQFSLSNATTFSRGAAILLVLKDTGDWERPFAIW